MAFDPPAIPRLTDNLAREYTSGPENAIVFLILIVGIF
jgi:hypothetical protein